MGDKDYAFHNFLGDKRLFLKFLRRILKRDLPDTIDLDAIALDDIVLENISFVSSDLSKRESDILYRIRHGSNDVFVYVLLEHQSKVDFLMPYRLLSYMVRIWDRFVSDAGIVSGRKDFFLPPIIPVVFYDGAKKWTADRTFAEKVANSSDFWRYVPKFEYRLLSLRENTPDEFLSFNDALGAMLYLANPSKDEDIRGALKRLKELVRNIAPEEGRLLAIHSYAYIKILARREGVEVDDVLEEHLEEKEADEVLTYLEKEIRKLKKEGREEGRKEGVELAKLQTVRRMLEKGMALSLVAELVDLPEEQVRRLAEQPR